MPTNTKRKGQLNTEIAKGHRGKEREHTDDELSKTEKGLSTGLSTFLLSCALVVPVERALLGCVAISLRTFCPMLRRRRHAQIKQKAITASVIKMYLTASESTTLSPLSSCGGHLMQWF